MHSIPVIDLFAGPGGLSEGFASLRNPAGEPLFDVSLSVEKDYFAHQTLELRSFFRAFKGRPPDGYYDYLRGRITRKALFSDKRFRNEARWAKHEAWYHTLAEETHHKVSRRVGRALRGTAKWVLIGGPPCQAYSVVGRSRMRSNHPIRFARDERHFLYREYLRIIIDHEPPIFVMENVRGLLSSTVTGGESIFRRILEDLSRPGKGIVKYRVVPFCAGRDLSHYSPEEYLIRSEDFGIPQTRHRVILCGIREDVATSRHYLTPQQRLTLSDALAGLPPLRSKLSREPDSHTSWISAIREGADAVRKKAGKSLHDVASRMDRATQDATKITETGGLFVPLNGSKIDNTGNGHRLRAWYRDGRLDGYPNHESRAHMRSDLYRYLFASSFAEIRGVAPKLKDFPAFLLPDHQNAEEAADGGPFDDRFRVQLFDRPATTIVSHIAKDGHYYIHPDPKQCRSLTVREAARLQTFPDNYFFEGNRTSQYTQVGNAVPPLLAQQIAEIVQHLLR